jgi:hypothetical protein
MCLIFTNNTQFYVPFLVCDMKRVSLTFSFCMQVISEAGPVKILDKNAISDFNNKSTK